MPFTIDNAQPVVPNSFFINGINISFRDLRLEARGVFIMNDASSKDFTVLITGQEFSDFYATWTTTEQLYVLVSSRLALSGNYQPDGEIA